jgi:hypothetical protein
MISLSATDLSIRLHAAHGRDYCISSSLLCAMPLSQSPQLAIIQARQYHASATASSCLQLLVPHTAEYVIHPRSALSETLHAVQQRGLIEEIGTVTA